VRARIIGLAVLVAAVAAVPSFFLFAQYAQNPEDERTRRTILWHFTASNAALAFPVTFDGERGLVFVDRISSTKRLIHERGSIISFPQLSGDGERLLFVRWPKEGGIHELLSCSTISWHCLSLLRTDAWIASPIEISKDTILYSSSPLVTLFDGQKRFSQHDFYLLAGSSTPIQLSEFRMWQLESLNLVGQKLIFSASGPPRGNSMFPESNPLAKPNSDIYMLDFDVSAKRIQPPSQVLKPLAVTLVGDYSSKPSISADGNWIAFLNRYRTSDRNVYHLALGPMQGAVRRSIAPSGLDFSRPAFVTNTILVNELFNDRYKVSAFEISNGSSRVVAELELSSRSLTNLPRIELLVGK
jgi:hypothetical protein